jgi:hypothetical protein
MANSHLQLVVPANEKPTVVSNNPAGRKKTDQYRDRKHLLPSEVEVVIAGAKDGRWGFRDATLIRLACRHGLRAKELVELPWAQIHLDVAMISIKRAKDGKSGDHPLHGDDIRALRGLRRNFRTARGCSSMSGVIRSRLTDAALVRRAGERAKMLLKLHPHMLRDTCGYQLANDGKDTTSLSAFSATTIFRTLCVTRNWRRTGSRISGAIDAEPRSFSGNAVVQLAFTLPRLSQPLPGILKHGVSQHSARGWPGGLASLGLLDHCLHHGWRLDVEQVEDQDSEIDERAGGANMVLGKSLGDLALVDCHGGRTREPREGFRRASGRF